VAAGVIIGIFLRRSPQRLPGSDLLGAARESPCTVGFTGRRSRFGSSRPGKMYDGATRPKNDQTAGCESKRVPVVSNDPAMVWPGQRTIHDGAAELPTIEDMASNW